MKTINLVVMTSLPFLAMSCGKKDDQTKKTQETAAAEAPATETTAAATNEVPAAANPTDVTSNIKRARAALIAGLPALSSSSISLVGDRPYSYSGGLQLTSSGLSDIWEAADMIYDPTQESQNQSAPKITLKKYVSYVLDDTLTGGISPVTMFDNSVFIFCLVNQFLPATPDATGMPADGDYTLTMTTGAAAVTANCPGNKDLGTPSASEEFQMNVTVSTLTDSAVFTKKFALTSPDKPEKPLALYAKTGADGTFNFGGDEIQDTQANRSMIMMDPVANTIRYEYSGQYENRDNSGTLVSVEANLSRLFVDNANHTGYMISTSTSPNRFQFVAGGETNGTHNGIAMSLGFTASSNDQTVYSDRNACIDDANASIKTDDSLTCGSVTIQPLSAATAATAGIIAAHPTLADYALKESSVLPFTTVKEMYSKIWLP